jgi:hypothetical protein
MCMCIYIIYMYIHTHTHINFVTPLRIQYVTVINANLLISFREMIDVY